MDITNKVIVVTGAGSGMGAATAQHFAALGAKVALLDHNLEAAEKIAREISGLAVGCDVTSSSAVAVAFEQIVAKLGVPRICVNCAGIAPAKLVIGKDHSPMELSDFDKVIQVNLIGTFNVMRVAAATMVKATLPATEEERGVIVNTASVAAYEGQMGQVAYSASKGGVVSMTLPAAREFARFAIRVMTIAPGLIETPMLMGMPESVRTALAGSVPFPKRFGTAVEYAQLVQHIVENPMLNGSVIRLDGALRMAPK